MAYLGKITPEVADSLYKEIYELFTKRLSLIFVEEGFNSRKVERAIARISQGLLEAAVSEVEKKYGYKIFPSSEDMAIDVEFDENGKISIKVW